MSTLGASGKASCKVLEQTIALSKMDRFIMRHENFARLKRQFFLQLLQVRLWRDQTVTSCGVPC